MAFIKNFIKIYRKYLIGAALIWAACLVLFLLVYMLVLGPQRSSKKRLESEIAKKKQLHESALRAAKEETKIQLNEQIENLRDRLKYFVIDFEDSANLTFDIGQIASEKKVTSFNIKSKDDPKVSTVPDCNYICENHINISFIAGFNQFATFVNALERHQPVLFVNKFTIIRSNQDDSVYQANLDVAAFVRKQKGMETADKSSEQIYIAKK
jgi:hypothetical protein